MKSNKNSIFDPVQSSAPSGVEKPMQVDVDALLKAKAPRHYRYIPRCIISLIKRIVHQNDLNELLRLYGHLQGAEFAQAMINHLNIDLEVRGYDNIPSDTVRLIFACNHPLGALDGISIISLLGNKYPGKFRFIVNDMLMVVPPLAPIFLPVNKHGAQSRNAANALISTMEGDYAIATFPAGLCSRNTHGSVIEDLEWKKAFIAHARQYSRPIVPMHFAGRNTRLFYRVAKLRKRLGIKFNIEMILLPREIFKCRNKRFVITFGTPINPESFSTEYSDRQWASKVRNISYSLSGPK